MDGALSFLIENNRDYQAGAANFHRPPIPSRSFTFVRLRYVENME
jgi:hypothetical protein